MKTWIIQCSPRFNDDDDVWTHVCQATTIEGALSTFIVQRHASLLTTVLVLYHDTYSDCDAIKRLIDIMDDMRVLPKYSDGTDDGYFARSRDFCSLYEKDIRDALMRMSEEESSVFQCNEVDGGWFII